MARSERVIGVKGVCPSLKEHMGSCRDEYTTRRIRCGAYVRGDKAGAARAALSCGHHGWRQRPRRRRFATRALFSLVIIFL